MRRNLREPLFIHLIAGGGVGQCTLSCSPVPCSGVRILLKSATPRLRSLSESHGLRTLASAFRSRRLASSSSRTALAAALIKPTSLVPTVHVHVPSCTLAFRV